MAAGFEIKYVGAKNTPKAWVLGGVSSLIYFEDLPQGHDVVIFPSFVEAFVHLLFHGKEAVVGVVAIGAAVEFVAVLGAGVVEFVVEDGEIAFRHNSFASLGGCVGGACGFVGPHLAPHLNGAVGNAMLHRHSLGGGISKGVGFYMSFEFLQIW